MEMISTLSGAQIGGQCCRHVLGRLELQLQEAHVKGVQLPQDFAVITAG